jgi:tetratricopeptide (TPR) repeat protein
VKLTIYRGDALIAQVALTDKPMKLGRSKDNEIVLEDPGKGVSRVHAELRPEGNRYRLVDLQSQNGIWVSGQRVPSVLLEPGVVAVMGPFRVALDATSPLTRPVPIIKEEDLIPETEYSRPIPALPPPPAPAATTPLPEPVAVQGAGALLDEPGGGTVPGAQQPDTKPSVPPAASKPAAARPPKPPQPSAPRSSSQTPLIALGVVVLIAASGFAGYKLLLHKAPPKPVWDAAAATALADAGRCPDALSQQIYPALAVDPNNAAALKLKEKCTAPPPPPPTTTVPPVVATKTNAEKLDDADAALLANSCQTALDLANEVLAADATDERATGLAKKADLCLHPPTKPAVPTAASDVPVKIPPAQGGLEPLPGEKGKDYTARVAAFRKRYDDAVVLLQNQRYQQALREFDALFGQVPTGYLDLAQRRGEARNGLREASAKAYADAQAAEQKSEWNAASQGYQRAHDMDPARDVSADLARVTDAKVKLARQLCGEADAAFSLNHNSEAADKYTRVLDLLPSNDGCYVRAKERLAKIR